MADSDASKQAAWDELLASEGMPTELPSLFDTMQQFQHEQSTCLEKAGVALETDSDVFMQMNGRNIFIAGEELHA